MIAWMAFAQNGTYEQLRDWLKTMCCCLYYENREHVDVPRKNLR